MKGYLVLFSISIFYWSLHSQTQIGADIFGEAPLDQSGWSVSISGDGTRIAIGAPNNEGNGFLAGHVRIFEDNNGSWSQIGVDIDAEAAQDGLGNSVSLSSDGRRIAIGAPFNDGNGNSSGQARVYEENSGIWTKVGSDIDGEVGGDGSGFSVSISGDGARVAIGAPANDGTDFDAGHVRIYREINGTWSQLGNDIDGEDFLDNSGHSVSLSDDGKRVAIGAPLNINRNGDAGHVRMYEENNGTWTQIGADIDGEAAGDQFGHTVSLSADGTRVAIGAPDNDENGSGSGHVRIYEENSGTWTQIGGDIDGDSGGDNSGYSVSLSDDGSRVAIGARSGAGRVRLYEENGPVWSQSNLDINGDANGDNLGFSVSLSANGQRVAIGAPFNSGDSPTSGQVSAYEISLGGFPFPVELIRFEGTAQPAGVLLRWQTATELNNQGFAVERSATGKDWQRLAFVPGQGATNEMQTYQFLDERPLPGINYYRLKQVDYDGAFEYSQVIALTYRKAEQLMQAFPNPSNGAFALRLDNPSRNPVQVAITNCQGNTIWQSDQATNEATWQQEFTFPEAGLYLVTARIGAEVYRQRVVVVGKQ